MLELGIPCVDISSLSVNGLLMLSQGQRGRLDIFTHNNINKDYNAIDIVMYCNHIFNPFAVDEGDIIYTPTYNPDSFKTLGEPTLPDGKKVSSGTPAKKLSYAERVEKAARTGLGVK